MIKLDTKQQVLLAIYVEYQKDIPCMKNVNNTALNMDITVFNIALEKLENEGYINGLQALNADNDRFYDIILDNIKLTRDGLELVESKFGISKALTAEEKLRYVIEKCGVLGLQALKLFGADALSALRNIS